MVLYLHLFTFMLYIYNSVLRIDSVTTAVLTCALILGMQKKAKKSPLPFCCHHADKTTQDGSIGTNERKTVYCAHFWKRFSWPFFRRMSHLYLSTISKSKRNENRLSKKKLIRAATSTNYWCTILHLIWHCTFYYVSTSAGNGTMTEETWRSRGKPANLFWQDDPRKFQAVDRIETLNPPL